MSIVKLIDAAIAYDRGDARRIQHFLKVYAYCRAIGQAEGMTKEALETLEAAAVLHDIGIHEAERKYGDSGGKRQETEGPPVARAILQAQGDFSQTQTERICWLIAHHHSYNASEELDFRILLEADFLVNAYEDGLPQENCQTARARIFRTETGKRYLDEQYLTPAWKP